MYVTQHAQPLDRRLSDRLWEVYELGFRDMSEAMIGIEMWFRDEFDAAMDDSHNRVWVVWDDDQPVGIALVATDFDHARMLNRIYFERHFPEHLAEGTIHYLLWMTIHPAYKSKGAALRLGRVAMQREAQDGALLVFDGPDINQPTGWGGIAELCRRIATTVGEDLPLHDLGKLHFFALDLARVAIDDTPDGVAAPPATVLAPSSVGRTPRPDPVRN